MNPRYCVGQKVIIKPPTPKPSDPRHSALNKYTGQVGTIVDYYWVSTHLRDALYIYKVKMAADDNEIVVHEDEIEEHVSSFLKANM